MESLRSNKFDIQDNDVIVIAQKIISKSENRIFNLKQVIPSKRSIGLSKLHDKDPRLIELILRESANVEKISKKNLIVETKYGFICANAGIDQSNVSSESDIVLLLPNNPDQSAKTIRNYLYKKLQKNVSVIISDTFGRPFRKGQTNVAIGVAGISSLKSYIGEKDAFGKVLKTTEIAVVDELASAAELVMGKTLHIPVAIIRGYDYKTVDPVLDDDNKIAMIFREKSQDLFRN